MKCKETKFVLVLGLVVLIAIPLGAQTRTIATSGPEADLSAATMAVSAAEAAGAPIYAKELYEEAQSRLSFARGNIGAQKKSTREQAQLRAVEALRAAQAAEARARLVQTSTEATNLSADIQRFGGRAPALRMREASPVSTQRSGTSKERVALAERAVAQTKTVAPDAVNSGDLKQAEQNIKTAKTILRTQNQSDSADHLAFVAEMLARRAEAMVLMGQSNSYLPGLRLERTRLAKEATELQAAEERRRRETAETEAIELRRRLDAESSSRQAQSDELTQVRQQLAAREQQLQSQLEQDRTSRVAAEARLDELRQRYEQALTRAGSASEVESLRRQVEDQRLLLNTVQQQEMRSEESMRAEISRLQQALENERRLGQSNVTERETALQQRQADMARIQLEREQGEQKRAEAERVHQQAIAESEKRLQQAQAESAQLRAQVEQTQTQLQQAREEIGRRDTAERDRMEKMQRELAAIAQTRSDARGFIITLPGLYFDTGKSVLKAGAKNVLNKIADQLKQNDKTRVSIEGHTDSVGSDERNMTLSRSRGEAVRDYLVGRGVDTARITTNGMGESAPIATNDTPAGRQQNRRVELIIAQ